MARRALLVGLNRYPNPENTLRGCLNDVLQMRELLRTHGGFEDERTVRLLTDQRATTRAIVERLEWLVGGARPGDVLVFHYSGHGAQVRDRHGDELDDGLDEIICPYDLDWDSPFTDDDLYGIVKDVPAGAQLTVVLDCCHSGTGLRDVAPNPRPLRSRCLCPPIDIEHRSRPGLQVRRFGQRASQANAILIAGCRSDQVSADAYIDGDYHGALTYYLCQAASSAAATLTYRDLVDGVRHSLRENRFEQVPQLEGPGALLREPLFSAPTLATVG
ncbi:MAG TPA: caspase family protein [Vicinamibacterales bacterium]